MREHVGGKPHCCKQYNNASIFSDALQIHMMHTGEEPYKFDQCDCTYTQAHKLQKHKGTHTGERVHKFDQFNIQMRRHTWEEPYRYIQCDYTCTLAANLHTHMLTHNELRPFNCDQCIKRFTHKSYLTSTLLKNTNLRTLEGP